MTHPHDPRFNMARAMAILAHDAWVALASDPDRGPEHPETLRAAAALQAAQQALAEVRRGILDSER